MHSKRRKTLVGATALGRLLLSGYPRAIEGDRPYKSYGLHTLRKPDRRARCPHRAAVMRKRDFDFADPGAMRKNDMDFADSRRDEGIAPYRGRLQKRSLQVAILRVK